MNFPLSHISSLCKYTGISFTAGGITHGFFSGERSFWTAAFGIAIYLIGGTLEKIFNPDKDHSWTDVLAIGIVASIGLGFFHWRTSALPRFSCEKFMGSSGWHCYVFVGDVFNGRQGQSKNEVCPHLWRH